MYEPRYKKSSALTFLIEEIERKKFLIERLLLMPKHEEWLRREAFIRTAYSSTMVENADITEEELERAAKPSPGATIPKDRPDVTNYAKALTFVDFLSDTPLLGIEQTIREIHWMLMKNIEGDRFLPGTYRKEPNWITDQGVRVYEPPFHVDIPSRMRDFTEWLQSEPDVHPLVRAGLAHLHVVAIHPFLDGNGRTARLVTTLLLQQSGYGFKRLLSLDSYYQRQRDDYITALQECLGSKFHQDYDATRWLEFFAQSVALQAVSLKTRLTDWRMMIDNMHERLRGSNLTDRQIDGLIYAARMGAITRKDYTEITGVSPVTATRDLAQLATMALLRPQGSGRNRRFISIVPSGPQQGELPSGGS